jgi:hypothetical protein
VINQTVAYSIYASALPQCYETVHKCTCRVDTLMCCLSCSSVLSKIFFSVWSIFTSTVHRLPDLRFHRAERLLGLNQRLLNYIDDNASYNLFHSLRAGWVSKDYKTVQLHIIKKFNFSDTLSRNSEKSCLDLGTTVVT